MWLFFAGVSCYLGYRLVRQGAVLKETRRQLYIMNAPYPGYQVQPHQYARNDAFHIALCPNCHREM